MGKDELNMLSDLDKISDLIQAHARQATGNSIQLLHLLRLLESLHQEIRDGVFQEALSPNRQALHALLRDMEAQGGWPYIPRMQLRSFLEYWESEDAASATHEPFTE